MDGRRFDDLTRALGASLNRKRFLTLITSITAPAVLVNGGAARKGKKRNRGNGAGDIEGQGGDGAACSGTCDSDADCDSNPECVCDLAAHLCVRPVCGGVCLDDADCGDWPGCSCEFVGLGDEKHCIVQGCGSICDKGNCGGEEGDSCVCNFNTGQCVTVACFGFCETNTDCQEQEGQGDCACFFGSNVDVASAIEVEAATFSAGGLLGSEGVPSAVCGTCIGAELPCNASTECCGQLVCRDSGERLGQEGAFTGTCQRKPKPKPKDRCSKHGGNCRRDNDCCAQAVCFKGKCGEKDTHCHNDSECAQGYRCQGGPLSPGHRRCRKNGRRNRNRRNARGQKR